MRYRPRFSLRLRQSACTLSRERRHEVDQAVYITVSGTVDAQSTAQQGVRDMAQRKADLIIVAGIDVNEANAENWNDALETARKAGVPVALLNPIAVPEDNKLYAATMTINDRMTDATPLDDAVMAVANNDPHDREMLVTTIDH